MIHAQMFHVSCRPSDCGLGWSGREKKLLAGTLFGSYQRGILESQSTFASLLILFGKTGTDERVLAVFYINTMDKLLIPDLSCA